MIIAMMAAKANHGAGFLLLAFIVAVVISIFLDND